MGLQAARADEAQLNYGDWINVSNFGPRFEILLYARGYICMHPSDAVWPGRRSIFELPN